MNKKKYSLLINGREYITYLKSNSLSVRKSLDDYSFNFTLKEITMDEMELLECMSDVVLKDNGKIVCAGLIANTTINPMESFSFDNKQYFFIEVTVETYKDICNRINVKELTPEEIASANDISINKVLNHTEKMFLAYFNKYLKQFNITCGDLDPTLVIDEYEMDEDINNLTLYQVFDKIADLTYSDWDINYKKQFVVYKKKTGYKTVQPDGSVANRETEEQTAFILTPSDCIDLEMTRSKDDYANRIIITGGQPQSSANVPDKYLDESGNLCLTVEDKTEQARIKKILGGDGVFTSTYTNSNCVDVQSIEDYASLLLHKYSRPLLTMTFDIHTIKNPERYKWLPSTNAGDFILFKAPQLLFGYDYETVNGKKLDYIYCCVDEINIEDLNGEGFTYSLTLSKRRDNNPYKTLADLFKKFKAKAPQNNNTDLDSNVRYDSINIQINNAITDEVNIYEEKE